MTPMTHLVGCHADGGNAVLHHSRHDASLRLRTLMNFVELLSVLALGAAIWFWFDSLRAREAGLEAARRACLREGLQFLDETVVGHGLRFARNDMGQLVLRRGFDFEYSLSGDDRYRGAVLIEGSEVVLVDTAQHRARVVSSS